MQALFKQIQSTSEFKCQIKRYFLLNVNDSVELLTFEILVTPRALESELHNIFEQKFRRYTHAIFSSKEPVPSLKKTTCETLDMFNWCMRYMNAHIQGYPAKFLNESLEKLMDQ
jgi:hypothetical protein